MFVIDALPIIREGLRWLFQSEEGISVVGTAASVEESIGLFQANPPDVVLVEIGPSNLDPALVKCVLGKEGSPWKVLLLADERLDLQTIDLDEFGAAGIVSKASTVSLIATSIRTCFRSGHFQTRPETSTRRSISLSRREIQLLSLLCNGLTSKEIAHELELSPRTVESYKKNVMVKVHARNSIDLSRFAFSRGLAQPWPAVSSCAL